MRSAGTYTAAGQLHWHPNLTRAGALGKPEPSAAAPLALIVYAMLTGRHYWDADNAPATTMMQLLTEVMTPRRRRENIGEEA